MCGETVENIDEAKDGRGEAGHEDDIELKYPGAAYEGGDEREDVTKNKKEDGSDSCGFGADSEGGILLECGGEY